MGPAEIRRLRSEAELSVDQLANELGVSPDELRAWESGVRRVPRRFRNVIESISAGAKQDLFLHRAGIPECDWLKAWEEQASSDQSTHSSNEYLDQLSDHVQTCSVCRARDEYLTAHGVGLEQFRPSTRFQRLLVFFAAIDRIWRRGRFQGPLILLSGCAGAVLLLRLLPHSSPLSVIVYLVAVAGTLIVGVWIYGLLKILRELGAIGRWLARCLAAVPALIVFMAVFMLSGYGDVLNRSGDTPTWSRAIFIASILGLGYATLWPLGKLMYRSRASARGA